MTSPASIDASANRSPDDRIFLRTGPRKMALDDRGTHPRPAPPAPRRHSSPRSAGCIAAPASAASTALSFMILDDSILLDSPRVAAVLHELPQLRQAERTGLVIRSYRGTRLRCRATPLRRPLGWSVGLRGLSLPRVRLVVLRRWRASRGAGRSCSRESLGWRWTSSAAVCAPSASRARLRSSRSAVYGRRGSRASSPRPGHPCCPRTINGLTSWSGGCGPLFPSARCSVLSHTGISIWGLSSESVGLIGRQVHHVARPTTASIGTSRCGRCLNAVELRLSKLMAPSTNSARSV